MSFSHILLPSILLLLCITTVAAHGFMNKPNIRGSLVASKFVPQAVDNDAVKDHWAHFPAGNRNPRPGSGLRSQIREAGPRGWMPFKPLEPGFKWRSGVCGDEKIPGKQQAHLRGGIYYHGGMIAATYQQGGIVDVSLSIIAHHNGFMELHVCDVKKCNGEISEKCFRDGHCQPLERAWVQECQSGYNKKCGPIDRNYPGRWYFPCSTVTTRAGWETYGGGSIKYRLPENLVCEHCVLQWFWSAANSCNPPGVVEYFDGDDGPKWGNCPGQGGAIGGVTRVQRPCGPDRFPEEYLDCADIRIVPRTGGGLKSLSSETVPSSQQRSEPAPTPEPTPSKSPYPSPKPSQSNTPRPSPKPSQSNTPKPSPKPSQSNTPRPSPKPSLSNTPRPTPKPSQSNTPRPSPKPSKSSTPRPSPKASKSSTPRPSPKPSKSNTPKPTPKAFRNRGGDVSAKASSSPSPTASTVPDLNIYPSMEPSFSPEESPEETLDGSMSPEPEWSLEPSGDDFTMVEYEPNERNGLISDIILVADGKDIGSVANGDIINIADYNKIAFRAVTTRKVNRVEFYINGDKVWTEHHIEYYMFGNNKLAPFYWNDPPLHTWIEVTTVAEHDEDVVNIMFTE